jgi:hypothetical protein
MWLKLFKLTAFLLRLPSLSVLLLLPGLLFNSSPCVLASTDAAFHDTWFTRGCSESTLTTSKDGVLVRLFAYLSMIFS